MISKTVTFVDYNGTERTETHWFNLNKAEIMEMQMGTTGGFDTMLQNLVATQDAPAIIKVFKDLVLKSYGHKSLDGRQFIKNEKIAEEFSQTEAYVEIFMELATDADAAAKFVNGIMPRELVEKAAELPPVS